MASEPPRSEIATGPALSQDAVGEVALTIELEPTADGGQRALVYPEDGSHAELATRWLAAPETLLVALDSVR